MMPNGLTLADIQRIYASLPPHPVAPENRGLAQLLSSPWVSRGQMYRLAAQPEITGCYRPTIVMNYDDVLALIDLLRAGPFGQFVNAHQEIADMAEQLFAEREVRDG
jgi:hypothetical protein